MSAAAAAAQDEAATMVQPAPAQDEATPVNIENALVINVSKAEEAAEAAAAEVETSEEPVAGGATPRETAAESTNPPTSARQQQQPPDRHIQVVAFGSFPGAGSILGPYFCLGRLGRGTFCSIHRCIDLSHYHNDDNTKPQQQRSSHRVVAAKVELSTFANSGVLDGEATMLQHLDSSLPRKSVPVYMGLYRADEASAIVMEYLPGEDMHQLRNRHTAGQHRRLNVADAVYLTADVMLPLLKRMHDVGVVHRDVKPSNCVRTGTTDSDRNFCLVDFGLSKSIVVPKDSAYADLDHPWTEPSWNVPPNAPTNEGCLRKERPTADFRGTSMYASLRVHQSRDYSRRDDMWSLLYVFCDLVSGGLPWMSYAAHRDREACRKLKESIQGESKPEENGENGNNSAPPDKIEQLLMGDEHHVSKYNRQVAKQKGVEDSKLPPLVPPLPMSQDVKKVELLRTAFRHVASLTFADTPDYDLIQRCMHGFLEENTGQQDSIKPIEWDYAPKSITSSKKRSRESSSSRDQVVPTWDLTDHPDLREDELLEEADAERKSQSNIGEPKKKQLKTEEVDMARLPLALQFRIAQMEYNTKHTPTIEQRLALRDWMKCVLPLLYDKWDSARCEKGSHRTNTDGYRREVYLRVLDKCVEGAKAFGKFRSRTCFYNTEQQAASSGVASAEPQVKSKGGADTVKNSHLAAVSKALSSINWEVKEERRKKYAPPPALSFGSGVGDLTRA